MRDPTHRKGNILDLVLTNDESLVEAVMVHPESDSPFPTDHFMVSFTFVGCSMCDSCSAPVYVYDYPKADWVGMCNHLLDCDFSMCFETTDVEVIWSLLKLEVTTAMDRFIPRVRLRKCQFPRWSTPSHRHQHKCLQTLARTCERSPSLSNSTKLRVVEEDFRRATEVIKASYESKLINDLSLSGCSDIYKYIGSKAVISLPLCSVVQSRPPQMRLKLLCSIVTFTPFLQRAASCSRPGTIYLM